MKKQKSTSKQTPLVSVVMLTYNHEKYIREAIECVLFQESDYPIELIIADDCSPDYTQSIVESIIDNHKRGSIIRYYRHSNNIGMRKNEEFITKKIEGDYVAICEGDDYWIDPLKLQKQIAFMESNKDYGMVYGVSKIYNQKQKRFIKKTFGKDGCKFNDLIIQNVIPTATVTFRTRLIKSYYEDIKPLRKDWQMGDYPLWLYISLESKIKFINETVSVYRVLEESKSHFRNYHKERDWICSNFEMKSHFLKLYGKEDELSKLKNERSKTLLALYTRYKKEGGEEYFRSIDPKNYKIYLLFLIYKTPLLSYLFNLRYKLLKQY